MRGSLVSAKQDERYVERSKGKGRIKRTNENMDDQEGRRKKKKKKKEKEKTKNNRTTNPPPVMTRPGVANSFSRYSSIDMVGNR